MERFSALNLGRIDSLSGVGQSGVSRAPGLARFLSQRADQVLGTQSTAAAVKVSPLPLPEPPAASAEEAIDPQLARQMNQLQRLHCAISQPANWQGISVLV